MKKYFAVWLLCVLIFGIHFYFSGHGLYGDGNAYWSYAHALFFNKNLDFTDIYHHLGHFQGKKYVFSRIFWDINPTQVGKLPNRWLIGTSLFWLPFMMIFQLFVILSNLKISPFSPLWEIMPGLAGITLAVLGLYFLEKTLKHFFAKKTAFLSAFSIFLASNMFYYASFEPALSHSIIFFLNSLILFKLLLAKRKRGFLYLIGFLWGLASIVRPTGVFIGIIIFFVLNDNFKKSTFLKRLGKSTRVITGALVGILPQLLAQKTIYGSVFYQPYLAGNYGQPKFSLKMIPQALFSPERGLYLWSPIIILATLGIIIWIRKYKKLGSFFISYLLACFIVIGSWQYVLSAGFGNRFFIELFPVLAFGLANMFNKIKNRIVILVIGIALLWNFLLLTQFYLHKQRLVDGRGLTLDNFLKGQLTAPLELIEAVKKNY